MNNITKRIARKLRKNQTMAEEIFWDDFRNRKFQNLKIVRQFPITFKLNGKSKFYVADFYCHNYKLIIEIDGKIHDKQQEKDKLRDYICRKLGYRVIRFKNDEIFKNIDKVKRKIALILSPKCVKIER